MVTIAPQPTTSAKRKTHSLKVDMTPMVDLGFLLITFFIFTAELSQPNITRLIMPKEGVESLVRQSEAITFLLAKDKAFAYEGLWSEAISRHTIVATNYDLQTGLGKIIRQKQKRINRKDDLVILLKPLSGASYQIIITALDEMQINNVKKYALVDPLVEEKAFVQTQ